MRCDSPDSLERHREKFRAYVGFLASNGEGSVRQDEGLTSCQAAVASLHPRDGAVQARELAPGLVEVTADTPGSSGQLAAGGRTQLRTPAEDTWRASARRCARATWTRAASSARSRSCPARRSSRSTRPPSTPRRRRCRRRRASRTTRSSPPSKATSAMSTARAARAAAGSGSTRSWPCTARSSSRPSPRTCSTCRASPPSQTMFEVAAAIEAHQRACDELRPWVGIRVVLSVSTNPRNGRVRAIGGDA